MTDSGDVAPVRKIQGAKTRLNWPAHIFFDEDRNDLYVANDGGHNVLVFKGDMNGNVAPDKRNAAEKIDGIVALIMALSRRGNLQKRADGPRERGILIL